MLRLKIIKIILLFTTFINYAIADITIEAKVKQVNNFTIAYYHDKEQKYDINTITNINFNQNTSNKFTFGYIIGDIWFKLILDNKSQNRDFVLHLNEPFFNEVNFWEYNNDKWQNQSSGLSSFLKDGDIDDINPSFNFKIEPKEKKIIYIQFRNRVDTKSVSYGEVKIFTQKSFNSQNILSDYMLYFFYFGTLFFIILFNIFLFIILRDSIYIYYVGYIFFTSIYILNYSGLAYYIGLAPWRYQLNISIPLLLIFFALFSSKFLNIKYYLPTINKILNTVLILLLLSIPIILIDYDPWFDIITQIATLLTPILIYASIYILIKGDIGVRYYIFALVVYMTSMMILSLMTQVVIANNDINHYAFVYGSYFELVLFSFVLANRFHKIQTKNEHRLEEKVKERTLKINGLLKEKDLLLKEVYHRVKNNFQTVVGLLGIEASQNKNQEQKEVFLKLIGRIKSMSSVHQYLLDSNNYSKIESREYLIKIINTMEQIYNKENFIIEKEIDSCILEMNQAMILAVIINEILTNAIKHHDKNSLCKIYFSFKKDKDMIILSIEDNGLGFEYSDKTDGFGLKMVKQFTTKLNDSDVKFSFESGTRFILKLKLSERYI